MSTPALLCSAQRHEIRESDFTEPREIGYRCWLPEAHDGPHWAIVTYGYDRERVPVAWVGDDRTSSDALPDRSPDA